MEIISFRLESIAEILRQSKMTQAKNSYVFIQKDGEEVFDFHFCLGSMEIGRYNDF